MRESPQAKLAAGNLAAKEKNLLVSSVFLVTVRYTIYCYIAIPSETDTHVNANNSRL